MPKTPSARAAALHALTALAKGRTDRLRDALDRARLRGREQALAFELGHGVLRRARLLDHVLTGLAHRGLPTAPAVRAVLRLGAYQLLFMAGVPRHAAVGETVALVRSNRGFVNAILRKLADCIEVTDDGGEAADAAAAPAGAAGVAGVAIPAVDPAAGSTSPELAESAELSESPAVSDSSALGESSAPADPVDPGQPTDSAQPADPAAAPTTRLRLGPGRRLRLPQPLPTDPVERLAIVHSLPDFLVQRWQQTHGAAALPGIAAAATAVPPIWLRPTSGDVDALARRLQHQNVETVVGNLGDLRWSGGESPFHTVAFAAGEFVVQDPTAYRAAAAVPCRPGDTVLDLCAAPGTKTVQLARRVRPGGRVLAFDPDPGRRGRIAENVARLRLEDTVELIDEITDDLPPVAATLVDVPCSNTGVLGRRVEVRQRLTPGAITELAALQRELLTRAIDRTRPGGHVVYSTCSIEPEENAGVVDAVLATRPGVERLRAELTLPRAGECDGGYYALLRVGPRA